jgi:hypothetical protein
MSHRTHSSEFPNANFELHDGAIWITADLRGRLKPIVRPRPPTPAPAATPAQPMLAVVTTPAEPVLEVKLEAPTDDFPRLLDAMVGVLLDAGATRAAAGLRALLEEGEVDEATFGDVMLGGAVAKHGSRVSLTSGGLTTARAWRSVLGGQSDDLSSCESTLDSWCAELLSSLSGKPAEELRKALRRRGVAAFGLLAA